MSKPGWPWLFLLLIATSACSTQPPAATGPAATYLSEIDRALATELPAILADNDVTSVSVAHIEAGRIVALQAAGLQAPGQQATSDTRYNVASLTKPITAEVALRLVSENAFTLDEPMAPSWVDPDIAGDPRHALLTPRHALSHRTGFPNWRDAAKGLRFERDPGLAPGYSGEGYEYLAAFIGHRTGVGLEAQARRLVFEPLGLSATSYTLDSDAAGPIAQSRDADGAWQLPTVRRTALASDDLHTTAREYARFMLSLMDNEALRADVAIERGKVQADRRQDTCKGLPAAVCPDEAGFALGWELLVLDGQRHFMHTGSDDDAFALAYWNATNRTGTVILTNSNQGYRVVLPILARLGANPRYVDLLRAMSSN